MLTIFVLSALIFILAAPFFSAQLPSSQVDHRHVGLSPVPVRAHRFARARRQTRR